MTVLGLINFIAYVQKYAGILEILGPILSQYKDLKTKELS